MEKEIVIEHKEYKDYKLILKVDLDEEDEDLLKKDEQNLQRAKVRSME